jgi:hypothetical protein
MQSARSSAQVRKERAQLVRASAQVLVQGDV